MPKVNRHPITGCRVSTLFGSWLMDYMNLESLKSQALSYDLNVVVKHMREIESSPERAKPALPYEKVGDRAVVRISGCTTKYPTSFSALMGGSSTVMLGKTLRAAAKDEDVKSIVMHYDTAPGGTVEGAFDFAQIIKEVNAVKPIVAIGSDMMASGGYLFASQASRIYANTNCEVGSIGTISYVSDSSKKYEAEGITVIPLRSGKYKGIGVPGAKISEEQIAYLQENTEDINDLFIKAVADARRIPQKTVRAMEAGVFIAKKALANGLIDEIANFEEVLSKPVPEPRGTRTVVTIPATQSGANPVRSKAMPLSAQQLETARKLPGAASITEENADTVLYDVSSALSGAVTNRDHKISELTAQVTQLSSQLPTKVDDNVAAGHVRVFAKELDFSAKAGLILPDQQKLIKDAIMDGDKPKAGVVQPNGTIMIAADTVMKMVELNKPHGLTELKTGAQPAPRAEPGKPEGENTDPSKVSEERRGQLLGHVGIKPGVATK